MKKLIFRYTLYIQLFLVLCLFLDFVLKPYLMRSINDIVQTLFFPIDILYNFFDNAEFLFFHITIWLTSLFWGVIGMGITLLIQKIIKYKPTAQVNKISLPLKIILAELALIIVFTAYILIISIVANVQNTDRSFSAEWLVLFAGSFIIGILWHFTQILWKKKRLAAWGMVITAALFFMLISGILAYTYYNPFKVTEAYAPEYENLDDNSEQEESDGEDYEEVGEWQGPDRGEEYIDSCLHYLVFGKEKTNDITLWILGWDIRHLAKPDYIFATDEPCDPKLVFLNDIGLYINYDNTRLLEFFYKYSGNLFNTINGKTYVESGMKDNVKLLLRTYNHLNNEGIDSILLSKLYAEMARGNKSAEDHYPAINHILKQYNITEQAAELQACDSKETVVWGYTFWARRQHDGLFEATYRILREVDNYYSFTETSDTNESNGENEE